MHLTINHEDTGIIIPVEVHDMYFHRTCTISHVLNKMPVIREQSLLSMIEEVYRRAGWKRTREHKEKKTKMHIEPIIEPPCVHFHRHYKMIGFKGKHIEQFMRRILPDFSIIDVILRVCKEYKADHGKSFPSERNLHYNRCVQMMSLVAIEQNRIEDWKRRHCNVGTIQEGFETFDHNPEYNHRTMTKEEKHNESRYLTSLRQEDRRNQREHHKNYMKTQFGRIISITALPILLLYMPQEYHQFNTLVDECERLENHILNNFIVPFNAPYISDQIIAMRNNRRYVTYLFQTQYFRHFSYDYLMKLKENEILFMKINALLEKEADEKIQQLFNK